MYNSGAKRLMIGKQGQNKHMNVYDLPVRHHSLTGEHPSWEQEPNPWNKKVRRPHYK
jgi:hypothetical protein